MHEKLIVGGSNILSRRGIKLISEIPEISLAFSEQAIIPAIRNSFNGTESFLESITPNSLDKNEREIIKNNFRHHVPWKLETATNTFKELLTSWNWLPPNKRPYFTNNLKQSIIHESETLSLNDGLTWISPKFAKHAFKKYAREHYDLASNYIDIAYRISGAHAVNSTTLLPANSCHLEIGNLPPLGTFASTSDYEDSIFWDCFVASIQEFDPESVGFSAAKLDALSMETVLKIREKLLACEFFSNYESIIRRAQRCNNISEAATIQNDSLILKAEFLSKIYTEANQRNDEPREEFIIEGASSLLKVVGDTISLGSISTISGLSKLFIKYIAWISPDNAKRIEEIRKRARKFMNGKTQTSRPLLEGYDAISIRLINKQQKNNRGLTTVS